MIYLYWAGTTRIYDTNKPERVMNLFTRKFSLDVLYNGSKIKLYDGKRHIFKKPIVVYEVISSTEGIHNTYREIYRKKMEDRC